MKNYKNYLCLPSSPNLSIKNIKFITFKKKIGPGIARNYGIKKAKGDFLVFLDSDDMLPDYCLENYYKIIINLI